MRPIKLKISDIAAVTAYSRFRVDGLLKQIFANCLGNKVNSQRVFAPQDLIVVAVACEIERKYGVDRKTLSLVGPALHETLTGARGANRGARLLVTFSPPTATYLDPDAAIPEGLVVALGNIFATVDEYLGVSEPSTEQAQLPLPLNPGVVRRSDVVRNR